VSIATQVTRLVDGDDGGMSTPPPRLPTPPSKYWYMRPRYAIWLGPLLLVGCLALRFAWGGIAGPPRFLFPVACLMGVAGALLTMVGFLGRAGR
jgi:hypothetical protein